MVDQELRYASMETGSAWETPEEYPPEWPSPLAQWVGAAVRGEPNHMGIGPAVQLTKTMAGAYAAWKTGKRYLF